MRIPNSVEMFIKEIRLFHTFDFSDPAEYITSGYVSFVFGKYTTTIGFTEGCYILIYTLLDILLLVPNFFFLLNETEFLLLFLFFLPLFIFLFFLLCSYLLFLFAL